MKMRLLCKIVIFALAIFLLLPVHTAHAVRTTIVISISVGGGVTVGAVAWYFFLSYSEQVTDSQEEPALASAQADSDSEGNRLKNRFALVTARNLTTVTKPVHGLINQEAESSQKAAVIQFLEFSW